MNPDYKEWISDYEEYQTKKNEILTDIEKEKLEQHKINLATLREKLENLK